MKFLLISALLTSTALAAPPAKRKPSSGQFCSVVYGSFYEIHIGAVLFTKVAAEAPIADIANFAKTAAALHDAGICTY